MFLAVPFRPLRRLSILPRAGSPRQTGMVSTGQQFKCRLSQMLPRDDLTAILSECEDLRVIPNKQYFPPVAAYACKPGYCQGRFAARSCADAA